MFFFNCSNRIVKIIVVVTHKIEKFTFLSKKRI